MGTTPDVTTLEEIVDKIENKYGMRGRVWVFDRGVVSEDNLQDLRRRGAFYLVGTRAVSSPILSASCLRVTGKKWPESQGCAFNFLKRPERLSS